MIKRIISDEQIEAGAKYPKGYGWAYYDYATSYSVCYRVPLNLIVRWWRGVKFIFRRGVVRPYSSWLEKRDRAIYHSGAKVGERNGQHQERRHNESEYRRGFEAGWAAAFKRLEEVIDGDRGSEGDNG